MPLSLQPQATGVVASVTAAVTILMALIAICVLRGTIMMRSTTAPVRTDNRVCVLMCGHHGLACVCDPHGTEGSDGNCSIATDIYSTNGSCPCKALVEGETCNRCKAGHYNLSAAHNNGCKGNDGLIVFNCQLLVCCYRMLV